MDSKQEEEIQQDAKRIMDSFLAALEKADLPDAPIGLEREHALREPGEGMKDDLFARKMLSNAPKVKDRCIVAEKKSW